MKRLAGTIVMLLALFGPNAASAAEQVGSHCEGGSLLIAGVEEIVFPLSTGTPSVPPSSSPVGGIATSWAVSSASTNTFNQRLKVLRTVPGADAVEVAAEAPPQAVSKGSGSFPIRIPVQAGDRFGLSGVGGGVVACETGAPEDVLGATSRNAQPGQSESFSRLTGYQLPLTVTVERDADGDGFGDDTQDRCVGTASAGSDCPVNVRITGVRVKRRAILLRFTAAAWARIEVKGRVTWRKSGLLAGVELNGAAKYVDAGHTGVFRLPLPRLVLRRLSQLPRRNSLVATIEASVTDSDGWESSKTKSFPIWGRR